MGVADGDDELMFRFQRDHDYQAFEELFGRHKDVLLRFLARLLGDIATAHDASQQTWLKVIEVARRQDYLAQPDARFRTWLLTLARNHAIDEYQRKFESLRPYRTGANGVAPGTTTTGNGEPTVTVPLHP